MLQEVRVLQSRSQKLGNAGLLNEPVQAEFRSCLSSHYHVVIKYFIRHVLLYTRSQPLQRYLVIV